MKILTETEFATAVAEAGWSDKTTRHRAQDRLMDHDAALRAEVARLREVETAARAVVDWMRDSHDPRNIIDQYAERLDALRAALHPEEGPTTCACGCTADQHHGPSQGCDGGHACGTFWPRREGIPAASDYDPIARAALHPEEGSST